MILDLQEQDSEVFDEILSILKCHPEIETYELPREPMLSLPGLEIYPCKRKVFRDRQEIQLTVKEYEILLLLAANKGHVLTYSQIYEKVWGDISSGCESNTIGFHICNLREKLYQAAPNAPFNIRSVREVGYCFEIQAEK
ncbi:MAG TPA: winged helix-turn-helix domain-containing protein [Candidatus Mediterraneibacter pullistercoris]|nr:winged helix-turn-helix domain-containing protein [Candidatus Mediterraneibacter pullistercoris]